MRGTPAWRDRVTCLDYHYETPAVGREPAELVFQMATGWTHKGGVPVQPSRADR